MKIMRKVWKSDHEIRRISSDTSSKMWTEKLLWTKDRRKRRTQQKTTIASNTFQKPPSKNRFIPKSRTRQAKSARTKKFNRNSMNKKKGVSPILKPYIRVEKISSTLTPSKAI